MFNNCKKLSLSLFFLTFICQSRADFPQLSPSEIGGTAYVLMDADSQVVLAQYHATERLPPASITKLMTAYVVYQSIKNGIVTLEDKTVISAKSREMKGSRMFLEQGSHVNIDNLLSGLVIQSGNDAAVALAEAIAGDENHFVKIMNKQAKALGMNDSQFHNVTGLPKTEHYMSAKDIATLSLSIIKDFPQHYKRYSRKSFKWNNISQNNRNALLHNDPSVDGLKTGHTNAAGFCLAASAKRGNMRLISVVLGTKSTEARAKASKKLLAYGFNHFSNQTIYQPGQQITSASVKDGKADKVGIASQKAIRLPLPNENPTQDLKAQLVLTKPLVAPINQGAIVGHFIIQRNNQTLIEVPAITTQPIEEIGFFSRLWRSIISMIKGWLS